MAASKSWLQAGLSRLVKPDESLNQGEGANLLAMSPRKITKFSFADDDTASDDATAPVSDTGDDAKLFFEALKNDDEKEVRRLKSFANFSFGTDKSPALVVAAATCSKIAIHILLDNGADPNGCDNKGRVPALVAAATGNHESLEVLLERGADVGFKFSGRLETGSASKEKGEENWWETMDVIEFPPVPECVGRTLLHEAALHRKPDCLEIILGKIEKDDENALQNTNTFPETNGKTASDVKDNNAELLLEEGHSNIASRDKFCYVDLQDKNDNTALDLAAKSRPEENKNSMKCRRECIKILLRNGATLSSLKEILTNVTNPISLLEGVFDGKIRYVEDDKIEIDFKILCPPSDKQQLQVLYELMEAPSINKCDRRRIFRHPLLRAFVRQKWNSLYRLFYINVFIYMLHVLSLSAFVTLAHCDVFYIFGVGWKFQTAQKGLPISRVVLLSTSFLVSIYVAGLIYTLKKCYRWKPEMWINTFSCILSFMVVGFTLYDGDGGSAKGKHSEALSLAPSRNFTNETMEGSYVSSQRNSTDQYVKDTVSASSLASNTPEWVLHVSSAAVFLAWLEMMFLVGRFPRWASQALLFAPVLKNVLRVLITYGCMIAGFAFVFFLQFRSVDPGSFGDPWRAFIKTIIMMMGEFEYSEIFGNKDGADNVWTPSSLPFLSRIIFLAFVILASIALMNLMLGLAVSDTQELQKMSLESQLMKLAQSVTFWGYFLASVSDWVHKALRFFHLTSDEMKTCMYFSSKDGFPEELEEKLKLIAQRRREDNLKQEISVPDEFLPTNDKDVPANLARLLNAMYGEICAIREVIFDDIINKNEGGEAINRRKSFYNTISTWRKKSSSQK